MTRSVGLLQRSYFELFRLFQTSVNVFWICGSRFYDDRNGCCEKNKRYERGGGCIFPMKSSVFKRCGCTNENEGWNVGVRLTISTFMQKNDESSTLIMILSISSCFVVLWNNGWLKVFTRRWSIGAVDNQKFYYKSVPLTKSFAIINYAVNGAFLSLDEHSFCW